MTIRTSLAAAALLLAGIGVSPVAAQMSPPNGMHNDDHGRPGTGGDMRHERDGAVSGRGPDAGPRMGDRHDEMRRDDHAYRGEKHKRCRTVWRNHHRVKRCS